MISRTRDGLFVASSRGAYIPGAYESARAARYAFRFTDRILDTLRRRAPNGVITFSMLQGLRARLQRPPKRGA